LDLAEKYEILKKSGARYQVGDGTSQYGKTIMENPEKYFTPDVMQALDEAAKTEYSYGQPT